MNYLDSPDRYAELRGLIERKPALKKLYLETYRKYASCLSQCPPDGEAIELGAGAGFLKEVLPEVIATDILPYPGIDQRVDATRMPYRDRSLRALFLTNVFHHISNPAAFLAEAQRCLVPGGRVLIVDQHRGWISSPVLRFLHREPFQPRAPDWGFESSGPLSSANGALTWIVFQRDRERCLNQFPELEIVRYEPHTPLRYWLAGGLRPWSLLPESLFDVATALDRSLLQLSDSFGSFTDVELLKRATPR